MLAIFVSAPLFAIHVELRALPMHQSSKLTPSPQLLNGGRIGLHPFVLDDFGPDCHFLQSSERN